MIGRIALALPVLVAAWIATLALVMALRDAAPAALVPFAGPDLLGRLPDDVSVVAQGALGITLAGGPPDLVRQLYAAGAYLVLPAGLRGCAPDPARNDSPQGAPRTRDP